MAVNNNPISQPPHDGEAETACLGGLLLKKDAIPEVRAFLKPGDFFFENNRLTFEAVCRLDERSEPVDILSLRTELKKRNHYEKIGGNDYLTAIYDNVVASSNVIHYANIIREKSLLRSLINRSQEIIETCYSSEDSAETILEHAEQSIFNIAVMRQTSDVRVIGDLLVETIAEIENLMKNKSSVTGIPSGLIDLDKKTTGFHGGQLIIIGGRPGMGKTSLALNITQNAGIRLKKNVVYFSLEMSGQELTTRVLCSEAMVDSQKIRTGYLTDPDFVRLLQVQNDFREAPIYIDDDPQNTVTQMRARLLRLLRKVDKIDLVVVDYLQLMKPPPNSRRSDNRQQDLAEISRSLKALARELDVPLIALTQLSRAVEVRPDSEPKLADIRESGAIEQDADIVIFLHKKKSPQRSNGRGEIEEDEGFPPKDPDGGLMELIIAKHRSGPTGRIPVMFLKKITRFESASLLDENIYNSPFK